MGVYRWVIEGELLRSCRPGWQFGEKGDVDLAAVDAWIAKVKADGVKSIICLLGEDQLPLYPSAPGGLVEYYRANGFEVAHVPTIDFTQVSDDQLAEALSAFRRLPKPVLVHCSAGLGRSGEVVHHIKANT